MELAILLPSRIVRVPVPADAGGDARLVARSRLPPVQGTGGFRSNRIETSVAREGAGATEPHLHPTRSRAQSACR